MIPSEENLGTKNDYEKTKQNNIKRHILEISNYIANQIEPTLYMWTGVCTREIKER